MSVWVLPPRLSWEGGAFHELKNEEYAHSVCPPPPEGSMQGSPVLVRGWLGQQPSGVLQMTADELPY